MTRTFFAPRNKCIQKRVTFASSFSSFTKRLAFMTSRCSSQLVQKTPLGPRTFGIVPSKALFRLLPRMGIPFQINHGEGAFYGPKIEFVLKDALNRPWQCGTLQLDYVLPQRLEARYIDEDNTSQTPIMLHRAIFRITREVLGDFNRRSQGHPSHMAGTYTGGHFNHFTRNRSVRRKMSC